MSREIGRLAACEGHEQYTASACRQGQACEHGGAHAGWAHRRPATPPACSTLASLREDVRGLEEPVAGVFMARPGAKNERPPRARVHQGLAWVVDMVSL